ncbi:hypothetical protein FRC07_002128 [Ceratobasidium sp. 392]|nr:hypothetical protein FRC07_002128 [Ceratobasidium sp. 392]
MSLSFSTSGKLGDLDSAIMLGSEAAYLIPEDHPKKPAILNDLGGNYRSRFGYLNETADLDAAIECHENAVSLTPDGQITTPRRLHNLGNSYFIRFRHLGQLKDIDKAIMLQTKAVCQVSDGNRYKPNLLSNLGNSYCGRYMHSEEATDCENAIKYNSAAVSLCPSDHPDKPTWLSHLASCYFARFRRQNTSIDLDKATELSDLAVSLVPDGHPDKSIWLSNLADVYDARFRHSGIRSDIDKSITCFMEASKSAGTPSLRLEAARAWAALAALHQTPSSLEAYSLVMALLPQVVWLGSTIDRRYKDLRDLTGIVNEAAAIAIDAERYDLGLEWLEEGRSIVWKQILQFRSPLDDLAIVSPTLADDLRDVAHKLEIAGVRDLGDKDQLTTESFLEDAAQSHRRLAEKWDELLRKVRDLPGFGNFLRPRKLDELRRATGSGAVVIVNVFMSHCESLVLLPDQPEVVHIPLPELSHNIALEIQSQLKGSTRSDEGHIPIQRRPIFQDKAADDQFKRVLETLWLDVVKPVLKHIGYLEPLNDGQRPHVTWCTTGPLAQLPLHAAGLYDERKEMAFDYVISSYTPTITALLTPLPEPSSFQGILAVGQASTSGLAALPGTTEELARIKQLARGLKFTQVEGEKATADAVLSAMEDHSWVHLACHALQDANHPTSSALQLHESKINLITIARRSFKHATFAFLSACQTATGDEYLPEEAVHLSAGMLMAGYPTVIGTMWSIRDEDAPLVAREVYSRLLAGGMPNTVGVAQALHVAVEVLRAKVGEHEFARWVPFIHIGV